MRSKTLVCGTKRVLSTRFGPISTLVTLAAYSSFPLRLSRMSLPGPRLVPDDSYSATPQPGEALSLQGALSTWSCVVLPPQIHSAILNPCD